MRPGDSKDVIRLSNGIYMSLRNLEVLKPCDPEDRCPAGTLEAFMVSGMRVGIPAVDAPTLVMVLEERAISCGPIDALPAEVEG